MNIAQMSDEEKSVKLATLCGWQKRVTEHVGHGDRVFYKINFNDSHDTLLLYLTNESNPDVWPNLYRAGYMHLAWQVLNWYWTIDTAIKDTMEDTWKLMCLPPANAQRAWLDEILRLAIEAGLVDMEE